MYHYVRIPTQTHSFTCGLKLYIDVEAFSIYYAGNVWFFVFLIVLRQFMLVSFCHCYLVDPASSHTLVLKIKPCMYKCFVFITLDCGRLIITVIVLLRLLYRWIPVVNPKLSGNNHPLSPPNGVDSQGYSLKIRAITSKKEGDKLDITPPKVFGGINFSWLSYPPKNSKYVNFLPHVSPNILHFFFSKSKKGQILSSYLNSVISLLDL